MPAAAKRSEDGASCRQGDAVPGVRIHGPRGRGPSAGFSLLELVLAMLVFSLLIGMVFTTARTSLQLSNEVIRSQNEDDA